jgi:RNA polymerase sigma-70 factor (ECF subfamily)
MAESVFQRMVRGDTHAARDCIDQFGGLVWSLARRLTRSRTDAEDAVQEIFLDLWRSAVRFDATQGSEKVFVTMIARRRLIDRLRKVMQEPQNTSTDELESLEWANPGANVEFDLEVRHATNAVAQLRPDQQQVLKLSLLSGMSHAEIAAELKMPLGTVKTLVRRGLIQVRALMGIVASDSSVEVAS